MYGFKKNQINILEYYRNKTMFFNEIDVIHKER